uniref:Very long-chain fatty acid transport protein n=1 Tax=Bionectria ochroleuca TaxID=29856 RepID=A0A8H7TSL5_BIOOC
MPVSLASVAAPAAALAAAAYINAKASVWWDLNLIGGSVTSSARFLYRQHADRLNTFYPFVLFEGRSWTFAQVYDKVLRYSTWLRLTHDVRPGHIVAMDLQNSDQYVFIWFAIWALGAKPACINYNLQSKPLIHCIKASDAKLCIIDVNVASNFDDEVRQELEGVTCLVFTPEVEIEASAAEPLRVPDEDRTQKSYTEMAMLVFTSGTTGLPKPAIVSWGKCIAGGGMGQALIGLRNDDIVYTCMPLYHSSAAVISFLTCLETGTTQAIGRKFSTRTFWDEVRSCNATIIQYVGETLRYLLATPAQLDPSTGENLDRRHSVRMAFGNGLRPDVWARFKDRFAIDTIAELYAATEGPFGTFNRSSNPYAENAIGRFGTLYNALISRNVALVAVDWDTHLPRRDPATGFATRVKPDISTRFQGYYKNPAANSSKILRDLFTKGDAWYRTGDVLRWQADGLVFFHDRIGDTYRWKSENVSTAEVAQVLGLHPSVREANVYGVQLPHHDGRAGLAAFARKSLPRYAVPLFLRVVDGEPGGHATGTMKQQKMDLRKAGVRPGGEGRVYWLAEDAYVPFGEKEWRELEGGRVKL